MSSMCDIIPEKCKGYDESIQIKSSPKEVAEGSDIIISGTLDTCISNNLSRPQSTKIYEMFYVTIIGFNFRLA